MYKAYFLLFSFFALLSCSKESAVVEEQGNKSTVDSTDTTNNNAPDSINAKSVIIGTYLGYFSEYYPSSQSPGYYIYYYPNCKLELIAVGDTITSYVTNLDSTYPGGAGDRFLNTAVYFPDTTTKLEMMLYPGVVVPAGCRSVWITYKPQSDSIYFNGEKVCSPGMRTYKFNGIKQ